MFYPLSGLQNRISSRALILLVFCFAISSYSKTEVPVFLLAGQSNMSGYASANDLTADQKKTVENVKIYADMTWENNGKLKTWSTLGPGFGSSANNIGPELYIGRTLSEKLPDTKIALLKVCCGSTYLGNYSSKPNDCWLPPSSNNGTAGPHYKRMLSSITTSMNSFNSAFDTTQYTPRLAGFVWLQGEFDGQDKTLSDVYQTNLTNLITDLRKDVKIDDLPAIIIMIDVQNSWQYNSIIRAAEVAVTKTLKNVDTVDTKGFPTDGTHYKAQGQVKIGTNTAERWLKMDYKYGSVVPVVYQHSPSATLLQRAGILSQSPLMVYSLSGRQIGTFSSSFKNKPSGIFITSHKNNQESINYHLVNTTK